METFPLTLLLLPLSISAGVDLYLTLLFLSIASLSGFPGDGDPGISGLLGSLVILGLLGLYVLEAVMERRPSRALVWHGLQLVLRPFGGALLGLFLLWTESFHTVVIGMTMAGVVTAFSHVLFRGQHLILELVPDSRLSPGLFSFTADLFSAALLLTTLLYPHVAIFFSIVFLTAALAFGRNSHAAVRFSLNLLRDRVWGIVSPAGWKDAQKIPERIRPKSLHGHLPRWQASPAAAWGLVKPRRFQDGWILRENPEWYFAFRQGRRPELLHLDGSLTEVRTEPLAKLVRYVSRGGVESALFLQVGLNGPESHK